MEIVLHSDFSCAPDGHTTYHYRAGDVLTGRAAQMAIDADRGFNPAEEIKVTPRLETKGKRN
jgi:hypothetical protein